MEDRNRKVCYLFTVDCFEIMTLQNELFTCNVQPLEPFSDWSRFLTRDHETPQEIEDPGSRGLATWCNGIA